MDHQRTYRNLVSHTHLKSFRVVVKETDLQVHAGRTLYRSAVELVLEHRGYIESFIQNYPEFSKTLVPWHHAGPVPKIIGDMIAAGKKAGVGPMAAVAGAIAEHVGRGLMAYSDEVIVENGGDLFVARNKPCTVAVYAGESPLSGKLAVGLQPNQMPCGVCCSSGTIGHSLSLGVADAVVVVSRSTALADAAATRLANEVGRQQRSINTTLELAGTIDGLSGVVIVSGEQLGAWGNIELVPL